MNKLILIIFFIIPLKNYSQNTQGKIIYKYEKIEKIENINPMDSFLSDIVDSSIKENKILYFKDYETNFVTNNTISNGMYNIINTDILYINHNEKKYKQNQDIFGKEFIVSDTLNEIKWIVDSTQIFDILGYKCYKATNETIDDSENQKKITIWFTKDFNITAGPNLYYIPDGVILKMEINNFRIAAISVEKEKTKIEIPKGKNIVTKKEFDTIFNEKLKELKSKKNQF
jgi:GLPGLI family protein